MRYVSCLAFNNTEFVWDDGTECLSKVAGVVKADLLPNAEAKVWGNASVADLIDAVECVGFDATEKSVVSVPNVVLAIEGMMCQNSCGTTVQNALSKVAESMAEASYANAEAKVW